MSQRNGMLIAFEGLDQSGKETQAQQLRERLREAGHKVRILSFPDYGTSIGEEIARALQGADWRRRHRFVRANRHDRRNHSEWIRRPDLPALATGSSIAMAKRTAGCRMLHTIQLSFRRPTSPSTSISRRNRASARPTPGQYDRDSPSGTRSGQLSPQAQQPDGC